MKILFHSDQMGIRGTEVALFDYALCNRTILGNETVVAFDERSKNNDPLVLEKFRKEFPVFGYTDFSELDRIIARERCDRAYFIKPGSNDGKVSKAVPSLVHAVFPAKPEDIHGSVYACVSEYLARAAKGLYPFVPHMIRLPDHGEDLRGELNIPRDTIVIGSYGGADSFDVPLVKECIDSVLERRRDIVFLFMNYPQWVAHERMFFLPSNPDLHFKVKFINTCDAMLHARWEGETFGLACGEFSSRNKPVISYMHQLYQAHFEILGSKAIAYDSPQMLFVILATIDRAFIGSRSWNAYSSFSPPAVMEKFKQVFLDPALSK